MIILRACLLAWVVSARTVAFHVIGRWREGRVCGLASSVGTLQAFGYGQQRQRMVGDDTVAALRPPSGVDRAISLLQRLYPLQDNSLIEKATVAFHDGVNSHMEVSQLHVALVELEEKYLNSKVMSSSLLKKMGEVYEMGLPQVMKALKNAHDAVITGIGVSSPSIKLAYGGDNAAMVGASAYTAARSTVPFCTSVNNAAPAIGTFKPLDSQYVVLKQQQQGNSSVSSLKGNESSDDGVMEVKTHIVDLQRPSTVENVMSNLQKQAVNSYKELGGHDDEEKDSGNQMAAVATKIEKDLDRILESCQQQPSRLPSDQKKELLSAIKKLKGLGSNLPQLKKIDSTAHVGVWSLVYISKERALKQALGGLLSRLACIRSPVIQIVEPNGTLVNEAKRCTVKEEGAKTVVIHQRRSFGIGPFRIFGGVKRAEVNLSYVGSRWKVTFLSHEFPTSFFYYQALFLLSYG